jgi:hypothetical protein
MNFADDDHGARSKPSPERDSDHRAQSGAFTTGYAWPLTETDSYKPRATS